MDTLLESTEVTIDSQANMIGTHTAKIRTQANTIITGMGEDEDGIPLTRSRVTDIKVTTLNAIEAIYGKCKSQPLSWMHTELATQEDMSTFLENYAPEVALCANHYKAKLLLGQQILEMKRNWLPVKSEPDSISDLERAESCIERQPKRQLAAEARK
jgi:hypothetical protein